ncbi:MAG TPA: hypothetical protein DEB31_05105 [Clostridiales bacterium]|nr:hypothetical protein [Clostridiales bacterium]
MKKSWVQTIGITAAAAVITVSVCGCSVVKRLHSNIESARAEIAQSGEQPPYSYESGFALPEDVMDEAFYAAPAEGAISEALGSASDTTKSGVDPALEQEYASNGLTYSEVNGQWWFSGKPAAAIRDQGHFTITNGMFLSFGAFVFVERDSGGEIAAITEISRERMEQEAGMALSGEAVEQQAKEEGYRYYREDVSVRDMTAKELLGLEGDLHVKYPNQKAMVQLNDYIVYLEEDDLLPLSSFCCAQSNSYGVKIFAEYEIAEEISLSAFGGEEIDDLLLSMLGQNSFENAQQAEAAAKQAVAEKYGVSTEHLVAIASLM